MAAAAPVVASDVSRPEEKKKNGRQGIFTGSSFSRFSLKSFVCRLCAVKLNMKLGAHVLSFSCTENLVDIMDWFGFLHLFLALPIQIAPPVVIMSTAFHALLPDGGHGMPGRLFECFKRKIGVATS